MKKFFYLSTIITFAFIISCGDEILDSPEIEQKKWINLPNNPTLGDTTQFDVTSEVVGINGGSIDITKQFSGGPHGQFSVSAKLLVLSGTFADKDTINFTLSVNAANTSVTVSPVKDYFTKPLKLTLTYSGVDLSGLDSSKLAFVYSNGTDMLIDVYYEDAVVDTLTGRLEVINAYIEYMPNPLPDGRYGWVRKAD